MTNTTQTPPKCYGDETHYFACATEPSDGCAFIAGCQLHVARKVKKVLGADGDNYMEFATKHYKETAPDKMQVGGTHYKDMPVQPWELMETILTPEEFIGFLKGTLIKYAMRAGKKPGSDDASKYEHCKAKLDEVLSKTCYNF